MKIPQGNIERRIWTKGQLERRGSSFSAIARRLGVSVAAACDTMMRPNERIEIEIARDCGVPVHELFADRHLPDGTRTVRTRRPKATTEAVADNLKTEKVA